MGETHSFVGRIYRVGILRCVDVPQEVGASFGEWRHAPVRMRVGEREIGTHLVPRGGEGFRLYLDSDLRKAAGVDTGDEVAVQITLDPSVDAEAFPDELYHLAERLPGGLTVLETLPPGLRRQILKFLAGSRTEAARRKALARIEELLRERAEKQGLADEDTE